MSLTDQCRSVNQVVFKLTDHYMDIYHIMWYLNCGNLIKLKVNDHNMDIYQIVWFLNYGNLIP